MQILVLGMHRSGTSPVTRLVNLLGAWVGDAGDLLPPHEIDNPAGYWESGAVTEVNDRLVHAVTGVKPLHDAWFTVSRFSQARLQAVAHQEAEAIGALVERLDRHRPWVLKDPRLCLVLPAWQPRLERPVHVVVSRSPLEVACSLNQRIHQPLPLAMGPFLWEK